MKVKIEVECGDSLKTLHNEEMTVDRALDLASNAVENLAIDDYHTIIRIITPIPNAVFSFSRTESTILICLNGKPYAEKEL